MDIYMHRLVRQGLWLGVAVVMAVTGVGCNTTTTTTEAVTVAEDTSSTGQAVPVEATATSSPAESAEAAPVEMTVASSPTEEAVPQTSVSTDPQGSRVDPFSEDSVQALEAMLRPLEAIPTETQATVSKEG